MSNLSELFPAGAGKEVSFVASGTIDTGDTVILNSDGTVSVVSGQAEVMNSGAYFAPSGTSGNYSVAAYDSNAGRVVIAYANQSTAQGEAKVGTLSGNTILFGTAVVFETGDTRDIAISYDENAQKVLISYKDQTNNQYGTAIVGTVSGTSISFGTPVVFQSNITGHHTSIYVPDQLCVLMVYGYFPVNKLIPVAKRVTISGTTPSFSGTYTVDSNEINDTGCLTYDTDQDKVIFSWTDQGQAFYGVANVITVTTGVSVATKVVFNSGTTFFSSVAYNTHAQKTVLTYQDSSNGGVLTGRIATLSGTTISFGGEITLEVINPSYAFMKYYASGELNVLAYRNNTTNKFNYRTVKISGSTLVISDEVAGNQNYYGNERAFIAYDPVNDYFLMGGARYAYITRPAYTNVTSDNFLGISTGAISNAASGSITVKGGVSSNVSGLTPNSVYYVQNDGSFQPTGAIPFNLNGASYDGINFSVNSQTELYTFAFSSDGTKLYATGNTSGIVYQYTLATAWNVGSASYASISFNASSQIANPYTIRSMDFSDDGTKMYLTDWSNNVIYQYTLSTAWNISTASYDSKSFSPSSQGSQPYGIRIENSGSKLYVLCDSSQDSIFEYDLSPAYDISTASYSSKSLDISARGTSPTGLTFSSDGTKLITSERIGENQLHKWNLSTAWDISTGVYEISFSVDTQITNACWGVSTSSDGKKIYAIGSGSQTNIVWQYSAGPAITSLLAGRALSATSIDLDYST